jgi:transposase-like protein
MTSTKSALPAVLKTDTKGRVRTPAADREAILDLFEQGGMSGAAFARLHGIRYPTFAHWCKQRRERKAKEAHAGPSLFQEVVLEPAGQQRHEGLLVELPLGARVRLERADQIPLIAVLCRHLRENAPHAGGA